MPAGTLPPAHSTCSLHPGLGVSGFQERPHSGCDLNLLWREKAGKTLEAMMSLVGVVQLEHEYKHGLSMAVTSRPRMSLQVYFSMK